MQPAEHWLIGRIRSLQDLPQQDVGSRFLGETIKRVQAYDLASLGVHEEAAEQARVETLKVLEEARQEAAIAEGVWVAKVSPDHVENNGTGFWAVHQANVQS